MESWREMMGREFSSNWFKHALNASEYTLTSWVGDNCCRWEGVGCHNETGHVIKLNLRNTINTVSGEIDPSLLELEHLSYLDLSGNDFGHKPIPKFLGSFVKLSDGDEENKGVVFPRDALHSGVSVVEFEEKDLKHVLKHGMTVGFESFREMNREFLIYRDGWFVFVEMGGLSAVIDQKTVF
ncbi:hypothetical protein MRB53_031282 [Persea americana]|uniref:Uncharacterized protein n=1 Tax=Persea americana TaxID=3435 RepID=A0ACC2KP72_PERAE|nr:hypothetical protein MRB53_031282 [Persea americana]